MNKSDVNLEEQLQKLLDSRGIAYSAPATQRDAYNYPDFTAYIQEQEVHIECKSKGIYNLDRLRKTTTPPIPLPDITESNTIILDEVGIRRILDQEKTKFYFFVIKQEYPVLKYSLLTLLDLIRANCFAINRQNFDKHGKPFNKGKLLYSCNNLFHYYSLGAIVDAITDKVDSSIELARALPCQPTIYKTIYQWNNPRTDLTKQQDLEQNARQVTDPN